MADQTVSVARNMDDAAIAGLANGENVTVDTGAVLTINSDSRWGQQAAVVGNITISSTTGGTVNLDGTTTWWIPFDAPTGNVPALGALNANGVTGGTSGATGEFLGIWTALAVAPSAGGGAIPATGFLKLRTKTGTFVDNEVITLTGGATVTVNSATGGVRGWLHYVGEEGSGFITPRLGTLNITGDWFYLADTNGADDQTLQYFVTDDCPAIQIETSAGSGVYEWYLNGGDRWGTATATISTDVRGKFFGMVGTTGVITIARRASNSCGYKPATGCKVRVPNIHISSSTSANWLLNLYNATLATRYDMTTTSAGAINIDKLGGGSLFLSCTQAYSLSVIDSCFTHQINIQEIPTSITLTNVAVGLRGADDQVSLLMASCFAGAAINGCRFVRHDSSASGDNAATLTDCVDFIIATTEFMLESSSTSVVGRGNASTSSLTLTRCVTTELNSCVFIGGRCVLVTCTSVEVNAPYYSDPVIGAQATTNSQYMVDMGTGCQQCVVDGFAGNFGAIANVQPYSGLVTLAASYNCNVRNIGTPAAPYNCGSANTSGVLINLGGNGSGHKLQRVYGINLRTAALGTVNSDTDILVESVWGDGGDSQALAFLDSVAKGCKWTNSVTGQTAVYGLHWHDAFISTVVGRIVLHCNEPTSASAAQCAVTVGTPKFTSTGIVSMPTLGQQVTWEMPYFAKGHTALPNIAPTITGTNTGNFTLEYQINTGSGFSAWKALTGANLVTETISSVTGFKLKIRATVATANATNALTYIRIDTTTTDPAQDEQYPLDTYTLTLTGLQANSDIVIYQAGTTTIRESVDANPSTSWGYLYSTIEAVDIGIFIAGYIPFYIRNYSLTSADASIPVAQVIDRAYLP